MSGERAARYRGRLARRAAGRRCGPRTSGARASCRTAIWPPATAARCCCALSGCGSRGSRRPRSAGRARACWATRRRRTMGRYLSDLWSFSDWLAEPPLRWLPGAALARSCLRTTCCGCARRRAGSRDAPSPRRCAARVLEEQRDDGLTGLPRGAVIHSRGDAEGRLAAAEGARQARCSRSGSTRRSSRCWATSSTGRSSLLLAYTGRARVERGACCARDALQLGSDGHPYLRYCQRQGQPRGDAADRARARRAARSARRALLPSATRRAPTGCFPPRRRGERGRQGRRAFTSCPAR